MTATKLEYYELAQIQLHAAIDHYISGNFIPSITLAAAAEEILGKLLPKEERALEEAALELLSSFPEMTADQIKDHLNLIRNGFKHIKEEICEQDIEVNVQAKQLILRACVNYHRLRGKFTNLMTKVLLQHLNQSTEMSD